MARALAAAIAKPDLAPVVDKHLQLLFRQSERYLDTIIDERGWVADGPLHVEVRTFWSTALGAALLVHAGTHGTSADLDLAGTLTIREPRSACPRPQVLESDAPERKKSAPLSSSCWGGQTGAGPGPRTGPCSAT